MNFFNKYFYGDYDAIKGGAPSGLGESEAEGQLNEEAKQSKDRTKRGHGAVEKSPHRGDLEGLEWPLWEIFIRSKQGLDHKHVGSLHAADAQMAIENARDVYTRRQEGVSIWVVESKFIHASNPDEAESFYEPANDKVYRHPTFYDLPDELTHI